MEEEWAITEEVQEEQEEEHEQEQPQVLIMVEGQPVEALNVKPPAQEIIAKIQQIAREHGMARIRVMLNNIVTSKENFASLYDSAVPPITVDIVRADIAG